LVRLLRTVSPQVILLDVEGLADAVAIAKCIENHSPGVPVIALGENSKPAVLLELMRVGVREFLQAPFEAAAIHEALVRVGEAADRVPQTMDVADELFAFLPSKPGVGTSTVALNLSAALARKPNTKVLLADFDLNSGLVGFMLKLDNPYSAIQAAENAFRLDENLWRQLVSSVGAMDVLSAGKINPGFRIEAAQIRSILDFARRYYKAISVDLSGNLEKYSVEIMHEAKRIFLVCTAELPSLHLAREKLGFLHSVELSDKVRVVLNRIGKRDVVSAAEVERLLGQPVHCVLPNDYRGIHEALAGGKPVNWESDLGKRFIAAADALLVKEIGPEVKKHRFVEYFSLIPARYTLFPGSK
jgi:pilus assembly protein CpaE